MQKIFIHIALAQALGKKMHKITKNIQCARNLHELNANADCNKTHTPITKT